MTTAVATHAVEIDAPDMNELLSPRKVADELGYVSPGTVLNRIHEGLLPALRVGNRFKIRRGDMHLLAKPVAPAKSVTTSSDLDKAVKSLVDTFHKLNAEEKSELGRLLAPAA